MSNKLLDFTPDIAFNLTKKLFYLSIPLLLVPSIIIGKYIACISPVSVSVPAETPGYFTSESQPNVLLGIFCALMSLFLFASISKALCQLIYILFRSLEKYIEVKDN